MTNQNQIIQRVAAIWAKNPNLRFCQLIEDIAGTSDIFYLPDEQFLAKLTDMEKRDALSNAMTKIDSDIADLECILTDCADDYTEADLETFAEDFNQLRYLRSVWNKIQATPVDECNNITNPLVIPHRRTGRARVTFPAGTATTFIRRWFKTTFQVSIKYYLTD